jgi:hypothetical protein
MKNAHLAGFVPPQLAEPVESVDIGWVDAGGMGAVAILRHMNLFE